MVIHVIGVLFKLTNSLLNVWGKILKYVILRM